LQIFNEISCRKVHDEFNVFSGIFTNYLFLSIVIFTAGAQAFIVEFGGDAFKVTGLSWDQWIGCIVSTLISFCHLFSRPLELEVSFATRSCASRSPTLSFLMLAAFSSPSVKLAVHLARP
jgi:hypothetical protein